MEYGKIISVTGMSGLFELVGSKKDGAIVKSLEDQSTKFVSSRIHNFSHLESIEVYTTTENINLVDLLKAMDESGKALPDQKDAAAVKAYFLEVYPDMDFERVYASDMKKMIKWYSVLKSNNVEFKLSEVPEEDEETSEAEVVAETATPSAEEKSIPVAKQETLPFAEEATVTADAAVETEAPKKRAPRKKKTEE